MAKVDCRLVPIQAERFRFLVRNMPDFALDGHRGVSQRSLDGAKRNPGFIRQTPRRAKPPPNRAPAGRDECSGERMTNASRSDA